MRIDLFLDDVRLPSYVGFDEWTHWRHGESTASIEDGSCVLVSTFDDARALIESADVVVSRAYLDHDLGEEGPRARTGYTFLVLMDELDKWPSESITVHSSNPAGRAAMLRYIARCAERRGGG